MVYRNIIGFILLSLFSINSHCQTASIVFNSENHFQVTINHIKQHNTYINNIQIKNLNGNHPYNIKINFKNDTISIQTNIYLIDDGLAHIYDISKKSIQLKKVVPAVSYPTAENQLIVNYTVNNNLPIDTNVNDTSQTDTTYVIPYTSYYKLEDYKGRIGCPFPIKDIEQAKLRSTILAENLEESKLEKIKEAILYMDSACILIKQTKELILLFEFEETRLDFAKFIFPYTFDIDNYEKLYPTFSFGNSKAELKNFIKSK